MQHNKHRISVSSKRSILLDEKEIGLPDRRTEYLDQSRTVNYVLRTSRMYSITMHQLEIMQPIENVWIKGIYTFKNISL